MGVDDLTGGDGSDTFIFAAVSDTGIGPDQQDSILDFIQGDDQIDVSGIVADLIDGDFTFISDAAFSGGTDGEIRFVFDGAFTVIQGDLGNDGDDVADFEILTFGNITFVAGDFFL